MEKPNQQLAKIESKALSTPESEDALMGAQLTEQYKKAVGGIREVVIFGAMMIKARDMVTVSARGHGGKFGDKGEGMKAWLEQFAPEVNRATAYRFMELAQGLHDEFKLGKKADLHLLLTAPDEELGAKLRKTKLDILDTIEGKSQRQLLLSFGKKHNGHALKNTKRSHNPSTGDDKTDEERAVEIWEPILKDLRLEGMRERSWAHLPDDMLGELKGLLIDLNKLVPEK